MLSEFAQLVISLEEKIGATSTLEFMTEHPEIFKRLSRKEKLQADPLSSLKNLNLTALQNKIIHVIHSSNNSASLKDIESSLEGKAIGKEIGGSLASISKKCEKMKIDKIISKDKNSQYSLLPEIYDFIRKNEYDIPSTYS